MTLTITVKAEPNTTNAAKVRVSNGDTLFVQGGEEVQIVLHDDKSFQVSEASAQELADHAEAQERQRQAAEDAAKAEAESAAAAEGESSEEGAEDPAPADEGQTESEGEEGTA